MSAVFGEDEFKRRREGPGNEPLYEMKSIEIGERRDQIPGKKYCPLRLGFRRLTSEMTQESGLTVQLGSLYGELML